MQWSPFLFFSLPQLGWILISFTIWLDIFLIVLDDLISECLEIPLNVILTQHGKQGGEGAGGERTCLLLSLACLVEGNPQPHLQWYFADAKVGASSKLFWE